MSVRGVDIPGEPSPESRFTWATDLCPHPEYWNSTDGDSTEVEVSLMIGGLIRGLQPDYCVETGCAFGQTTAAIGHALLRNGHGFLDTMDADIERCRETEERMMPSVSITLPVRVHHTSSMEWWPTQSPIDFAFFDSLYELRVPEFQRYRPFMRAGTIVAFHDSAPEHGSHRIASGRDLHSEILAELPELNVIRFPTPRGITIGEVK